MTYRCDNCGAPGQSGRCRYCRYCRYCLTEPDPVFADVRPHLTEPISDPNSAAAFVPLRATEVTVGGTTYRRITG